MKKIISLFSIILLCAFAPKSNFLAEQKKYARVRTTISEKNNLLLENLKKNNLKVTELQIMLVAFKNEDIIELFAKNKADKTYKKIATYDVCARSGTLGPKRKSGDGQVPEGFYYIDRFNAASSFYLSLGINYPNQADKIKSTADKLGGDIFIHGSCVTIGCIPMTDDKIKEIYLYAVHAKNNGQNKIPVYIFPFKMNDKNLALHNAKYGSEPGLESFWKNLKVGYDKLEKEKKELAINIAKNGDYQF